MSKEKTFDELDIERLAIVDKMYDLSPPCPEGWTLNIVNGNPRTVLPDVDYLRSILRFEPETGDFYWKVDRGTNIKSGTRAGSLSKSNGYMLIGIEGKVYKSHQLALLLYSGEFKTHDVDGDELVVDHVDGDRSNNRIENLRYVSNSVNVQKRVRNEVKYTTNGVALPNGIQQNNKSEKFMIATTIRSKFRKIGATQGTQIEVIFNTLDDAIEFKKRQTNHKRFDLMVYNLILSDKEKSTIEKLYSGELCKVKTTIKFKGFKEQ